ncbi:hypothetical protein [Paraburkholderia sp. MM6662-R1]|uniref:hypothetical protein n=1 Tax=Paraburkholderia sp. MM6662-R1 TaxID=2991066 RepID=UPI003D2177BA
MPFNKVSRIQWAAARAMWESDPRINFVQIAESLGTTRQAVQKRSSVDGWAKRTDMDSVAEQAQRRADSKVEEEAAPSGESTAASPPKPSPVVRPAIEMREPPVKNRERGLKAPLPVIPPESTEDEARRIAHEAAVERRAEVLTTHRKEWIAVRTLAYATIKSKDMEAARHVKTVAESLKIVQEGERKAWGLDTEEKKPGSVQIVINRRAGVTIGH